MTFTNTQTKLGQAITTNDSGDYAVRTIIEGDQTLENLTLTGDLDAGGGHILNDQTDINQDALGPAYSLDGTNDKIAVANNVQVDITTGDFSMYREIYVKDLTSAITLWEKWEDAGDYWYLQIETTGAITFKTAIATVTKGHYTTAAGLVTAGKNVKIGFVSDRDGVKGQFYVNLLPVTTTETTAMAATSITNTGALNFGFDGATAYSEYEDQYGSFWNIAHTAAQVKDVKNIPFKWVGGSQTDKITDVNDRTFAAASNWVNNSMATYSEATNAQVITSDASGQTATLAAGDAGMTVGKAYLLTFTASSMSGDGFTIRDAANGFLDSSQGHYQAVSGANSFSYIYTGTNSGGLRLRADGTGAITIDDYSVIELGAVALYDQTSISETYWYDKANGNNGAVTGASVLNPPSVTPLSTLHSNIIRLEPGGTPGTNINCSDLDRTTFGQMAITDATNLAKSGSSGSFALDADGKVLTITLGKTVVGTMGQGVRIHDVNSSSTSELYFPYFNITSGNLVLSVTKRGSSASIDLTTILDAGDIFDIWVDYVTST